MVNDNNQVSLLFRYGYCYWQYLHVNNSGTKLNGMITPVYLQTLNGLISYESINNHAAELNNDSLDTFF